MRKLLIANRGEVAVRIARAAAELGIASIAMYSEDDGASPHVRAAHDSVPLRYRGTRSYLDIAQIVSAAKQCGAEAIHPGYGFLSENASFAEAVQSAGLIFIGPTSQTLAQFGDKVRARALAQTCDLPVLRGSEPVAPREARAFFDSLPAGSAMVIKAVFGGGGRGLRIVHEAAAVEEACRRAAAEAKAAFGDGAIYAEEYLPDARHIEVQIIGDAESVSHLWERECTLQRRHQKVMEIAPSPTLPRALRNTLAEAAARVGKAAAYRGLGTIEFLVSQDNKRFCFIECNPRLQVEHTVTEEVLGIDLVRAQIEIACGRTLRDLALTQDKISAPRGYAIQARINLETMMADGSVRPSGGVLNEFVLPGGPGVRVDTYGHVGYETNPAFDSLIAKIVCHSHVSDYASAVNRMRRALAETRIAGAPTNLSFLRALLEMPEVQSNAVNTNFIDAHAAALVDAASGLAPPQAAPQDTEVSRDDTAAIRAPMQGTIVSLSIAPGDAVWIGKTIAIMEAMKMQHEVRAEMSGVVQSVNVAPDETVFEGRALAHLEPTDINAPSDQIEAAIDPDHIRPDLAEALARKAAGHDARRAKAVARRHQTGRRTARENIADLCDRDSFVEYGSVVLAAQRQRRPLDDLIAKTTGDGMVCGLGHVNGALFPPERTRVMAMSYDYMVLAGTQGKMNHRKKDRMFHLAEKMRLPIVLFAEGGGGRPGDTDIASVAGLDCLAFNYFARLSGSAPLIGITTGYCFAGNAVLLGCCDVVIATEGSNIGVGGPAMIEGGGLGIFRPEEIGPMAVQVANGVVDIAVKDEAEAVAAAKQYLSYFQGPTSGWTAPDARALRFIVPESRLRYYDMRKVIEGVADIGSILELRAHWGVGMITALMRIEGQPIGVIANNPAHLSGAIDAPGADKAARFMQLCDAFDLPILTLIDCPGIMVGPEIEKTALVRHASRLMVTGANIETPLISIVIRKGYGLGAQAMAGGSFRAPDLIVTWPTGEFGGMGLEGAVKLGFRKELEAIDEPAERKAAYDKMVAASYERGKAVNMASHFELDDVIDPAETRRVIMGVLTAQPPRAERARKKRPNIDTW